MSIILPAVYCNRSSHSSVHWKEMRAPTRWIFCLVLAAVAAAQQTAQQADAPGVLEGRVVDGRTGESIRKAHVSLELSASGHDSALVATTDEAGHFRFAEVKPGVYQMAAEKGGFLGGGYGETKPDDDPTLLRVGAGDRLRDLAIRLFPAGVISGQISDSDGDPVSGYEVVLWARQNRRKSAPYSRIDETTTNHQGGYRFDGLMPGTYYVSAGKQASGVAVREIPVDRDGKTSRIHELWTFYPAVLSIEDAQAVRVNGGQEQAGIDIRIQSGPLLAVKGRIAGAIDSVSKYQVSASVEEGLGWTSEAAKLLPTGEFTIELPPGKHTLALMEQTTSGPKDVGATEINLAEQDLSGVVITLAKRAQVRVRVVVEGEEDKPLTQGAVSLFPPDWDGRSRSSFTQYPPQNGTYVIDQVPPGKYRVWFNNAPDCYLKSVQSGGRTLDSQLVEVTEGANLDLLLTYSKNVASVTGDLEIPQDEPKSSLRVLLISIDPAVSELERIRTGQLDQSLHFSLEHMRPGRYVAFASQEDDFDLWDNSEFVTLLQSEGTERALHESEHATIHLTLIPKEVTDRIKQQLGEN